MGGRSQSRAQNSRAVLATSRIEGTVTPRFAGDSSPARPNRRAARHSTIEFALSIYHSEHLFSRYQHLIKVQVRQNESLEAALRRFKRQCNYSGIFRLYKANTWHEKRSDERRRERRERLRTIQKASRKSKQIGIVSRKRRRTTKRF